MQQYKARMDAQLPPKLYALMYRVTINAAFWLVNRLQNDTVYMVRRIELFNIKL